MKKLMIIPALMLVAACDSANKAQTVTVAGVECETITTGPAGDVIVKCPMDAAFEQILAQPANAMFIGGYDVDQAALAADAENVYVNVVENDCGPDTTGYRFMLKNVVVDGVALYAVATCENK